MIDTNKQIIKAHLPYILSLLVLSLLPRIYFATPYLFDGDPVNYYLGAKNLLEGNGYVAMGIPVIWPVGYSLTIIPFLFIFDGVAAASASSIIFSTLGLLTLYLIGVELFSKRIALVSALLFGFSETYFFNSVNVASDTHALFFTLASIYFFIKFMGERHSKWAVLSGLFISYSVITRYQTAIFILLPFIYLYWENRNNRLPDSLYEKPILKKTLLLFFLSLIPFALLQFYFNYSGYGSILPFQYAAATSSGWENTIGVYLINFVRILYRIGFSIDFYAPLGIALALVGVFTIKDKPGTLSLLMIWSVLGLLPMSIYLVIPRYFFLALAPFTLLMAAGAEYLFLKAGQLPFLVNRSFNWKVVLASLLILSLSTSYLAKSLRIASSHKSELSAMSEAFDWIKKNTHKDSAVITQSLYYGHFSIWDAIGQDVWVGEFYSGREVYSVTDDLKEISRNHPELFLIINDYWQNEKNLLMMYSEENREGTNRIFKSYKTEMVQEFATQRDFVLWKLSSGSNHPDYSFVNDHLFKIYRVTIDSLR